MSGCAYHPIFRMTPENGAVVYYDLREVLGDAAGPTRTRLRFKPDQDRWEDVNRRMRVRTYGFRMEADLTCDIIDMTDQNTLREVVNRLAQPAWVGALSLDAGVVYRDCVMTGHSGPDPLGGKHFAGARFEVSVSMVDLLDEIPALASVLGSPNIVSSVALLPLPAEAYGYQIWTVQGPPDSSWQSLRDGSGSFGWRPIATGGP